MRLHPGASVTHDRELSIAPLFTAALATLGPGLASRLFLLPSRLTTLALTLAGTAGLALLGFTIAAAWLAWSTAGARAGATGAVRLPGLAGLVLGLHVAFVLLVAVELSTTFLTFDLVLHARPPSWRFNELLILQRATALPVYIWGDESLGWLLTLTWPGIDHFSMNPNT